MSRIMCSLKSPKDEVPKKAQNVEIRTWFQGPKKEIFENTFFYKSFDVYD